MNNPRQIDGDPPRRWFFSEDMELVLWLSDDRSTMRGFQLMYPAAGDDMHDRSSRKVLTWLDGSFSHESEDGGEDRPFRYKMTPIAVADGVLDHDRVLTLFMNEAQELDSDVVAFVTARLREYSP